MIAQVLPEFVDSSNVQGYIDLVKSELGLPLYVGVGLAIGVLVVFLCWRVFTDWSGLERMDQIERLPKFDFTEDRRK